MYGGYIDLVRNEIRNQQTERLGASSWKWKSSFHHDTEWNYGKWPI
jgi:hypothetical protein